MLICYVMNTWHFLCFSFHVGVCVFVELKGRNCV